MANVAKSQLRQHVLLLHVLTKDEELEVAHESESDFLRRCQISHDNPGSKNFAIGRPLEKPIKSRHRLL